LKLHPDLLGQAGQQQRGLAPGRVDLVPLHGDAWKTAQP
jgi:hypothetical protein